MLTDIGLCCLLLYYGAYVVLRHVMLCCAMVPMLCYIMSCCAVTLLLVLPMTMHTTTAHQLTHDMPAVP